MNDDKTLDNNKVHKLCTDIRVCLENNIDHISCDKTDIKEAGHANAPKVETLVCEVLEKNFKVAYETEKNNTKKSRSLSDIIVDDIYCNVKSGVSDGNNGGRPNLCSLKRLFRACASKKVEAYIIIWVKSGKIRVFDLLSNLKYVVYNDGTGQSMLKETLFLKEFDNIIPYSDESLTSKCEKMREILRDGYEKHRIKKRKDIDQVINTKIEW
jgi:hypothetical protein